MEAPEIASNYFKRLQRGSALMELGRWREALHEYSTHLSEYPGDYTALCNSAICHKNLREFQSAYDLTKQAIEAAPENEWAYRVQSAIFARNGEPKRALDAARLCIEKEPGSSYTISCLFWAQCEHGDLEDAEGTLKLLLRRMPSSSESFEASAYLAMKQQRLPEAEGLYLEALKLNPESTQALNNLGVIYLNYLQNGKGHRYKKKSVEMFERAVRVDPTFKLAQRNISTASTAIRTGAPIGLILLLYVGVQVLGRVASATIGDEPGAVVNAVEGAMARPSSTSSIIIAANILSGLIFVGLMITVLASIKSAYRERITYEMSSVKIWLISSLLFIAVSSMYLVGFYVLGENITLYAGIATFLFVSLGAASLVNLTVTLIRRRSRRSSSMILN